MKQRVWVEKGLVESYTIKSEDSHGIIVEAVVFDDVVALLFRNALQRSRHASLDPRDCFKQELEKKQRTASDIRSKNLASRNALVRQSERYGIAQETYKKHFMEGNKHAQR